MVIEIINVFDHLNDSDQRFERNQNKKFIKMTFEKLIKNRKAKILTESQSTTG